MKTPIVVAAGLLIVANVVLASVVGYSVRGRAKAEDALNVEVAAHRGTQGEVARLERQVEREKEVQKHLALKAVEDLAAKQKEYDGLLALMNEMTTPIHPGERYDENYTIDGCSAYQLKLVGKSGNWLYVSGPQLPAYWKARAGVTVMAAVAR